MNNEEKARLKKEYESIPDEELLEMLLLDESEYEQGVYELVEEEAERRGLGKTAGPEAARELSPYRLEIVHMAKNIPEADLIRVFLAQHGIDCFYSEFPLSAAAAGGFLTRDPIIAVPVMVRETDADRAREIMSQKE